MTVEKTVTLNEKVDPNLLASMTSGAPQGLTGVPSRPVQENDAIPRVAPKWLKHDRQVRFGFISLTQGAILAARLCPDPLFLDFIYYTSLSGSFLSFQLQPCVRHFSNYFDFYERFTYPFLPLIAFRSSTSSPTSLSQSSRTPMRTSASESASSTSTWTMTLSTSSSLASRTQEFPRASSSREPSF